ncbi:hypothetical protein GJ744_004949 [Endocarpon pusillum]|uniref:Uncharacterized protein n=1 Tax=Endocarpon pusillum TaxID=364733 RepID=A0A8H7ACS4_9EURO|nr:hypothetical protein GJ744_004949 [Endocarpon pusillum]
MGKGNIASSLKILLYFEKLRLFFHERQGRCTSTTNINDSCWPNINNPCWPKAPSFLILKLMLLVAGYKPEFQELEIYGIDTR